MTKRLQHALTVFILAAAAALPPLSGALAVMPDEILSDPALEARARLLSQELRCLVCQNQSIDDSSAPLARDLRLILRERLSRGDSDAEAMAYLQQRYGNFVLLKPPFSAETAALWLAPALVLLGGASAFAIYLRRRKSNYDLIPPALTEAEHRALAALTGDLPQ